MKPPKIIKTEYIKRETIKGNDGIEYCYAFDTPIENVIPVDVIDKIRAEVLEYIDDLDIAYEICGVFDKYKAEIKPQAEKE